MISNRDRIARELLTSGSDTWHSQAACANHDPELFYSIDKRGADKAKAICRNQCPVREQCLRAGRGEQWGVWGGLDEYERRGLKRPNSRMSPPWTQAEVAQLKAYAEIGLAGTDIAKRLGRTHDAVKWVARQHNIKLKRTGGHSDAAPRAVEMIRAGRPAYIIAAEMRVTTRTVQRWQARLSELAS